MTELPLALEYGTAILDLDGCTFHGDTAIEYVPETLEAARATGIKIFFLTNNSSRTPEMVAEKLSGLGIPTEPSDIVTSAQAAAAMVAQKLGAGAKVFAIGTEAVATALAEEGLERVESADDNPIAVLQGLNPKITLNELSEAAIAIQRGAEYFATNLDPKLPNERGFGVGNGSLVAAVVNTTGVTPTAAGKPEPAIFHLAAERAGASNPLTVGDQLITDVRGAVAAGMPALHVLTGVSPAREVILATLQDRPSHLGLDMRDLLLPYEAAQPDGEWWACVDAAARVQGSVLELRGSGRLTDGQTVTLHEYRALAAAAWHAAESGEHVSCPDLVVAR